MQLYSYIPPFLKMPRPEDTLPQCPGDHPILNWGLKLNSKILAGKHKKIKFTGAS